jgi:threonine dehydrogenase-like Zn-dependent dehydrogenase
VRRYETRAGDGFRCGARRRRREPGRGAAIQRRPGRIRDDVFRNITLTGGVAPARAYIERLLPDVLDGKIEPGKVFDRTVGLDDVPAGYRAMANREVLKVMVRP